MFGRKAPAEPAPDPAQGWQTSREQETRTHGRPIGWSICLELFEKASFPLALIAMLSLQWWEALWITLAAETGVLALLSFVTARREAPIMAVKTVIAAPLRYGSILFDLVTFARFFHDIVVHGGQRWRK
jgi:hypothetical protein